MRYRLVDYSAPTVHAHKKVTVKDAMSTRVEIALGADIVARHRRSYRGDVVYDPLHYLSLLEKKPGCPGPGGAAAGVEGSTPAFDTLRRLLEARFGPRGMEREYIQVLRLHEDFPERQVVGRRCATGSIGNAMDRLHG